MSIVALYKTTSESTWETRNQAEIAEILESTPAMYLESYRLKAVVETLSPHIVVIKKDNDNETN